MQGPDTVSGCSRRLWLAGAAALAAFARPGLPHAQPLAAGLSQGGRFAAVDWAAAESLLALGIVPIAVSEIPVYRQWLPEIPLPTGVVDLGSRTEPNLELLASLRPERIFLSNWQRNLATLFERIAPTETVAIVDSRRRPLDNARDALLRIGGETGTLDAATDYLRRFDRALAGYAKELSDRPRATAPRSSVPYPPVPHPPVYVGVLHENGSQIFVYGDGSWVGDLLSRLGLRNALGRPTSAFGNALLDLAQVAESPDATLLYLDQGDRTRRAERRLRGSTLWRNLPMVAAGRVRPIPAFYALGGLPSVWHCARLLTRAAAGLPEAARG